MRPVGQPAKPDERGLIYAGEGPAPELAPLRHTSNVDAADTTNSDQLWAGGGLGLDLNGQGYAVGVWDGGWIRQTHQEFGGRVSVEDSGGSVEDHSTHVGGTIGAQGIVPAAHGMANQVQVRSYEWTDDITELSAAAGSIVASNHSYSFVRGWTYGYFSPLDFPPNGAGYYGIWYAARDLYDEDPGFGKYSAETESLDQALYDHPDLLSVWAAANDRNDDYASLNTYYLSYLAGEEAWYWIPTDHATYPAPGPDGSHDGGYDTLPEMQTAKNNLVVGAIEDITADPYSAGDVVMTTFSSWGATDDGRVKPDVVGNGYDVYSTVSSSDTAYEGGWSGTSMAAPNVTGTASQLIEHFENHFGLLPRSATTKAILIHTAFDAGNIGPDYAYGWGVVDAAAAAGLITAADTPGSSAVVLEDGYVGLERAWEFTSDGGQPLKATLVWTDPPGSAQPDGLDDPTPVLVNDLDLWITGPGGTHYPWTLDPASPASPAVRTTANHLDNVEQVLIDASAAGTYTVHVGHTGTVTSQDFSLLVSGGTEEAGADLVGSSLAIANPVLIETGGRAVVDFTVANQGTGVADAFDVKFYLSQDAVIDPAGDVPLELSAANAGFDPAEPTAYHVASMAAGATHSDTVTLFVSAVDPFGAGMDYYLGMVVDADADVTEINEGNNRNRGLGLDQVEVTYATTVFSETLDGPGAPSGWTVEGEWEFGVPGGSGGGDGGYTDPTSGYTGSNVYGVNLAGDYADGEAGPFYLTTAAIDTRGYQSVTLDFYRWLNTDRGLEVPSTIDVTSDDLSGGSPTWHNVYTSPLDAPVTDDSWQLQQIDISAYADNQQTVHFRWGYEKVGKRKDIDQYSGWNVDDVELVGTPIPAEIRGAKFEDRNGDGVRDASEPGLAGWTIFLDDDNDGVLDPGEFSTTTDSNGDYAFTDLAPATYDVAEVQQSDWVQTFPAAGSYTLSLAPGEIAAGQDFGNYPLPATISGTKFNDLDGDGQRDAAEPGLADVTVYLDLNYNGQLDAGEPSTQTRADDPGTPGVDELGTYALTVPEAGTHAVAELVPAGYVQTFPECVQNEVRRVSLTYDGVQADFACLRAWVSDDGRHVIFSSGADNLVPLETSGMHYFVRDIVAGTTEIVSVNSDGQPGHPSGLNTDRIDITPGGRFAVFGCDAGDLVPGDTNNRADVYLRDRKLGITERISLAQDGSEPNGSSLGAVISDDGRYVVFHSWGTNLVPNDNNGTLDVFLYDRQLGQLRLVSAGLDGNPANGRSMSPDISGDGRYVVFQSNARNLVPEDTMSDENVFLYDIQTGELELGSRTPSGAKAEGRAPTINRDGRFIAFECDAPLNSSDTNARRDVYVRDRQTGEVYWASRAYDASAGNGDSLRSAISADGRWVTFVSDASSLVPSDTNNARDVFLYSLDTATISRVSVSSQGGEVSDRSDTPSVSVDGRYVAFESYAPDVVPDDTNGYADVFTFVRDSYGQHLIAAARGQIVEDVDFGNHTRLDFGDAPDGPYPTLLASNGARHEIVDNLFMGATVDWEADALPSIPADGDDNNNTDDEDGLVDPAGDLDVLIGETPTVDVKVTNNTGTAATLYGWIDYNGDGVFDNGTERASIAVADGTTNVTVTLIFPVVPVGSATSTYARFRLSTDPAAANATGPASDGEVEDYTVTITRRSAGMVEAHQKISDTQGNFIATLDDHDSFGYSVANAGDLDGDGVSDLAVGTYRDDDGDIDCGAVWILFLNADGTVKAHQKISATEGNFTGTLDSGDYFGSSVANVGDLDGDGVNDLAVGARCDDDGGSDRGAVWILFLNPDGTVKAHQKISDTEGNFTGTLEWIDYFGWSVANLGDLDGDSVPDLAVGAWGDSDGGPQRGAVWILFLNSDGTVKTHQKISDTWGNFTGTLHNGDVFGSSLANVGDLNGDGVTDLAVGAYGDDDGGNYRGAVWTLFLNSNGTVKAHQKISDTEGNFTGTLDDGDWFGSSVARVGDLDVDGVTDLAVGALYDADGGPSRGAVWMLFINSDGTVKRYQKISDTEGNFTGTLDDYCYFGTSVGNLGDLDGNGVADLAVGACSDDDGGPGRGAVWMLFLAPEQDYGDAPDGPYATLCASNGPRHGIVSNLFMGATVDAEADAFQSAGADGDDDSGADDEDGLVDPAGDLYLLVGETPTVDVRVTNNTGTAATLYGWIDYNGDGVFDNATERASVAVPSDPNEQTVTLTFPVVPAGFVGDTYARFRLSTDPAAANPTGAAADGEIEDYEVSIHAIVVGRHVFYNNSAWDWEPAADTNGNGRYDPGEDGANDDDAIAPDKEALLPGQTAAFANYISYSQGINGIMVDIDGLPDPMAVGLGDFQFRYGNDDNPSGWTTAPNPSLTVRPGEGVGASDRFTVIWPDSAVPNKNWLEVTLLAAGTGLAEDDRFYFGLAVGETGNSAVDTYVDAIDASGVYANPHWFLDPAPVDDVYDFNRDRGVDAVDASIVYANPASFFNGSLALITPSAASDNVPIEQAVDLVLQRHWPEDGPARLTGTWLEDDRPGSPRRPPLELPAARGSAAVDELFALWEGPGDGFLWPKGRKKPEKSGKNAPHNWVLTVEDQGLS